LKKGRKRKRKAQMLSAGRTGEETNWCFVRGLGKGLNDKIGKTSSVYLFSERVPANEIGGANGVKLAVTVTRLGFLFPREECEKQDEKREVFGTKKKETERSRSEGEFGSRSQAEQIRWVGLDGRAELQKNYLPKGRQEIYRPGSVKKKKKKGQKV